LPGEQNFQNERLVESLLLQVKMPLTKRRKVHAPPEASSRNASAGTSTNGRTKDSQTDLKANSKSLESEATSDQIELTLEADGSTKSFADLVSLTFESGLIILTF
jgi:hypothetical protein